MDLADYAQEVEAARLEHLLREREAKRVKQLSTAYCEECGDRIPDKRRMAVSGVRHCVSCQEDIEWMERRA